MEKQYALVTIAPSGETEIIIGNKTYITTIDGHKVIVCPSKLIIHSVTSASLKNSKGDSLNS